MCVRLHVWRSEDTLQGSLCSVHHVGFVIQLRLPGLQEPLLARPSCHPVMFLFLLFCFKFKEQDMQGGYGLLSLCEASDNPAYRCPPSSRTNYLNNSTDSHPQL